MKSYIAKTAILAVLANEISAFSSPAFVPQASRISRPTVHHMSETRIFQQSQEEQQEADTEIERLKLMAQKLRAEAAILEAERAEEMAQATEQAFSKFDLNKDGEISFEELKEGLERELKTELPEERVKRVMEDFDVSGDGKLQMDEFVTLEQFRNKLEALAREEKAAAREAIKAAQMEEEMAKAAEVRLNMLNDKEPTGRDKIVSVLPYLFPLVDSLQFGKYLVIENSDNPFLIILALMYALFRSVPFGGFIAFLALNTLSSFPNINRLVRFNMQQAIFIDIALFFPALFGSLLALIGNGVGLQMPGNIVELGSDFIFISLLVTLGYASVSSLLGITPNKIPLISKATEDRMLSPDMFDESGRFSPRLREEKKDDNDKQD